MEVKPSSLTASYTSSALGRRREQFAFETIPLTFEKTTGEPVLLKEFTTYEFTAELARRLRPQGKFIIANAVGPTFPFTYHLLDIHGYEWGIDTTAAFARTIAYHKPVVSLPVQPPHQAEQWVKAHLRYGVMPGGYANSESFLNREAMVKYSPLCRALQVAGWEPVTLATSNQPELQVERFGAETDGLLFLTVYNHAAAGRPGELRLDLARLHVAPDASVTELVSGRAGRLAAGVLAVDVAAHDVQVWRIGR